MKTWWQRKTVGVDGVLLWALGLLVVGVFLLWATAGRAGEYCHKLCTGVVGSSEMHCTPIRCSPMQDQHSNTMGPYHAGEAERSQRQYEQCYQRMEAAMKAMDGSLDPHDADSHHLQWLSFVTREQWQQWDAVKRECWRKP